MRTEAVIIDGKAIARAVRREVKERAAKLKARGIVPGLGIVLAGGYAPSEIYVRSKQRAGARVGIEVEIARFGDDVRCEQLVEQVERWNGDDRLHGMIVQLPLPGGVDSGPVIDAISPDKDADGLTPASLGRLLAGRPHLVPATPAGIVELLVRSGVEIAGRSVVIVGRSELVGKPLANLLLLKGARGDATVTVCHSRTPDLGAVCRTADILVVAVGRPQLVTADMVKPGAVVIDVGTNRTEDGLVGDVDFAGVVRVASAITPVPGGVGPMTVAMLLHNTVRAAEARGAV
jgi:methylenetetrahydrofolate dehydrogenase (NADP+)/methenyltetrahydrofolate cyclohydrolase